MTRRKQKDQSTDSQKTEEGAAIQSHDAMATPHGPHADAEQAKATPDAGAPTSPDAKWVDWVGCEANVAMWGVVGKVLIRRLRLWCLRQYSVTQLAKRVLDVFRIV